MKEESKEFKGLVRSWEYKSGVIKLTMGKFGGFIRYNRCKWDLPDGVDPLVISNEEVVDLIENNEGKLETRGRSKVVDEDKFTYKRVLVNYNKSKYEAMESRRLRTGMSRAVYLRSCEENRGVVVVDSGEYKSLIAETKRVGNNLNQIARKLNQDNSQLIGVEGVRYFADAKDVLERVYDLLIKKG